MLIRFSMYVRVCVRLIVASQSGQDLSFLRLLSSIALSLISVVHN